ncbi:ABC-2 type transport system ATP-binding protein [Singulisphaera sp. GP187]|uniref:ABC transporter ATP-binding protein n=1 Tax=Singulisphaera sp. GP187 TaxID=1882752 RepID=UPI000925916A|nr:ABC transporter ATP-binding protein [Singulisphaera sp. GP187]SIO66579.1 ABC-2 type transport system ATP-binding protein [Singulisphaera sp. GP187]
MLQAVSLTKAYQHDGPLALDRLDLTVKPGEVFCLLGPNGAGKTTTVHLFLNFIAPSSGQALVCGIDSARDPLAARRKLAYIPENVMLYGKLSGLENLAYFSALATGVRRSQGELQSLLVRAGLPADAASRPVAGYSKGMRQKVGIAIALAKQAETLLLDEPTSGLDPLAANEFARLIESLRQQDMAVLMVTHDLFLAQQCGTRVGIMQRGKLVFTLITADTDHLGLERAYLEASRVQEVA